MVLREYVNKNGRQLRLGVTTGSCAALAAGAATRMLLSGKPETAAAIVTPGGKRVEAEILEANAGSDVAVCAVRKDAGDDPDVTDGVLVFASVEKTTGGIVIDGGSGVGRVTRAGLDQPVGAAAINSVPRQMIERAARDACAAFGYAGGLRIVISIPEGEAIAARTFNARLGIVGGLSVLGTSGIVEPMSDQAVVDTMAVEMNMLRSEGVDRLLLTPGNYGEDFIAAHPELSRVRHVKCSNFIGDALDLAVARGFSGVVVVGHIGKMIKLAGGVMNTHSRIADCRLDLLALHAGLAGGDASLLRALLDAPTVDAGLDLLAARALTTPVMQNLLRRIDWHLGARVGGAFPVGAFMFSSRNGLVAVSDAADSLIQHWNTVNDQR